MWFYDDRATRLKGCVVSRFQWKGRPHVVLSYHDAVGHEALVIREVYLVCKDADSPLGFGSHDDDLNADLADIIR
jgi:hypothetical protein